LRYAINTHKPQQFYNHDQDFGRTLGHGAKNPNDQNWRHPNDFGFR
jgi:hypothetical protein